MRAGLLRHGLAAEQVTAVTEFDVAATHAIDAAVRGDTVLLAPVFDVGAANVDRFNRIAAAALAKRR